MLNYSLYPRDDVLCIDMRSFYASIEAVKLGLNPMEDMIAVVGDPNRSGSIVLAASPMLKETYAISNVSRFYELPKDPNIYIVQAHMGDYVNMSLAITKLLLKYVPKEAIHVYSIDETWLTVNGLQKVFGNRRQVAKLIQQDIFESFGLTCSIGVGDNKFLAKVVMDLHAKKLGIAECAYEDVSDKLWPFPVEKIWGIGSRMQGHLNNMGIITFGQLAKFSLPKIKKRFGIMGEQLYWHAWGIDLSPVFGDFLKSEQKGFGHGITLLRDYSQEEISTCILDLCEEVCRRARETKKVGKTIQLGISYSQKNKNGFSRSLSTEPTNITKEMYNICMQLFEKFHDGESDIRRVYVTLSNLYKDNDLQLSLFHDYSKQKDISFVMDEIRNKYGDTAILRASSYTDSGITIERSKKIGGHYA